MTATHRVRECIGSGDRLSCMISLVHYDCTQAVYTGAHATNAYLAVSNSFLLTRIETT